MTDKQEVFRKRLIEVLRDLQESGSKDPETMWLMGSLAARLIDDGRKPSWPALKSALSDEAYDRLLLTFKEQGNELASKGNVKAAYAVQALALSIVGSRINNAEVSTGVGLLDDLIAMTVNSYRRQSAASPDVRH